MFNLKITVIDTSITSKVNPAEPMHLNFFDSIAKVEIRPCVHWSFTRNLISRDHSKKPPWWLMRGDNLRKVANIGL